MAKASMQLDFLIDFILSLLENNGIELTESQKKMYVPQLLAQVEARLGLQLLPKLNDAQKEKFAKLTNDKKTTPGEWKKFWYAVSGFEEDVKSVLGDFAAKVKQGLGK